MAWTTPERPARGEYEDREKVRFAIGLELEGTVARISPPRPSSFGGEVVYVDVDTTDGRKVAFGVSGWKLTDYFEPVGYQAGDGLRVVVESAETKDGKTFGRPVFSIDKATGSVPSVANDDIPF
jgi:hypothetical protein